MPDHDTTILERDGRVWMRGALDDEQLLAFDRVCRTEATAGNRISVREMPVGTVGPDSCLTKLARRLLPRALPVRVVVFNKTAEANWQVPWHQDRVITVRDRHDLDGFSNWSRKSGTWHVEPPLKLLQSMLFARLHLDDNDQENGCLELALGTHRLGRVASAEAADVAGSGPTEMCSAERGDVLFVKALTLHRSRPSRTNTARRTIRIDYCAEGLPPPLAWDGSSER